MPAFELSKRWAWSPVSATERMNVTKPSSGRSTERDIIDAATPARITAREPQESRVQRRDWLRGARARVSECRSTTVTGSPAWSEFKDRGAATYSSLPIGRTGDRAPVDSGIVTEEPGGSAASSVDPRTRAPAVTTMSLSND